MTREQLFNSTFATQLAGFAAWKSLVSTQSNPVMSLAPSDLPGFEIITGAARYSGMDSAGHPTQGVQEFTLRVHYAHSQLALDVMRMLHAQYTSLIEGFFSGGYIPPSVSTGDLARIDGTELLTIEAPILSKTATRSAVTAKAQYFFTLF